MTRQATSEFDPNSVRKSMIVQASPAVAWRVFTQKMSSWWPLDHYKIGKAKAVEAIVEPHVGGRWYERGDDGSTCDWGRVLVWEPPTRLVLTWDINADWQFDAKLNTEIEIRFIAQAAERTLVELEHRHLDRFGDRRDQMRRVFDQEGDWGKLLGRFAKLAEESKA